MAQIVKLKRTSVAGKVPSTSNLQLGELAINTNDGRIFFKKNDGSDSIEHIITTDSITTGSITINGGITAATLTLSGLSAQNSETDVLTINGSNIIGTRQLGSNAFNSTAIPENLSELTNDSGFVAGDVFDNDGTFASLRAQGTTKGDVGLGLVTNESKSTMFISPTFTGTPLSTTPSANDNSTKIATTAYVQTELTDLVGNAPAAFDTLGEISASLAADSGALDSLTTVVSGKLQKDQNLSDLSNVSTARTNLGVDASGTDNSTDVTLAGNNFLSLSGQEITAGTVDISSHTNLAVSDTTNVDMILSGNTLSANLKGGVVSGSGQVNVQLTQNYERPAIVSNGIAASLGSGIESNEILTLLDGNGIVSGSSQIDHDATTNFNANEHFTQASITTVGTIGTGVWQGTAIASAYLDSDTAHLSGTQTFSGAKTFSAAVNIESTTESTSQTTGALIVDGGVGIAKNINVGGNSLFGDSLTDSHIFSGSVTIEASGSTVFDVQGSQGQLFSLTDSLSGDIFSVGDISGDPIFNVNSSGIVTIEDQLDVSGSFYATGDVVAYASSDERLKDNLIPIGNPNEKIKQIGGYEFDWNENQNTYKGHDVGVIAQEIEKVLPEVVTTRDNGYKAVKYEKLVALLIESNKELINRVEELEKKLEDNGNI